MPKILFKPLKKEYFKMEMYHNLITEKSFLLLKELKKQIKFTLIGGWAVWLWAKTLKSKDIDIIIDYSDLGELRKQYEIQKNERLKKYEIKHSSGIDVDIYLSHYSNLGVDVNDINKNTFNLNGFMVPQLELLFLLKLYANHQRQGSLKGKKDEVDIFSLAFLAEFDWRKYQNMVKKYHFAQYHNGFVRLLKRTKEIKETDINQQKMARKRTYILGKING